MNPSTAQALVMVDELLRCGVTDVVLAPGSRSTPLALALADAERDELLALHVRLDERSAGYLALGIAKVTGVPAAVVTTSGTAAINLHPAIVEADESGVALLAITTDRPPALRGVGANQVIAQPGVFGPSVRQGIDMGVAENRPGMVGYWRSTISRAVARSTDAADPGPVHLNVPFAEPLVPDGDDTWCEDLEGRSEGRPWTADARLVAGMSTPMDDVLNSLFDDFPVPAKGLIVVGDHDDPEAVEMVDELGDMLGWPVIGEPSSNAAGCSTALSHGPLLLADQAFAGQHVPEVVLTVGRVGLSRAIHKAISAAGLHIAVDSRPQWSDPTRSAAIVLTSVPLPPEAAEVDESWLDSWQRADVLAAAAAETVLARSDDTLTGVHVARMAAASVPQGGLFFVGPSWSVRHVAAFAGSTVQDGVVLGNRGTSGIDGCVSTAWGAALALQRNGGAGAIALLGDQTFLYDSNGLAVPAEEERPDLTIVVSDNDGGGIFSSLEQGSAEFEPSFERVFGVPLAVDLERLCASAGVPCSVVETAQALRTAIDDALGAGGVRVVIARTCERGQEAAILTAVQAAVSDALESA